MIDLELAGSRPLATARSLAGGSVSAEAMFSKHVVLTGESATLLTANGRWCLLDSLRLLARIAGNLTVVLPADMVDLAVEAERLARAVCFRGQAAVVTSVGLEVLHTAAALLHVGPQPADGLPWIAINSNGWVARVSSCGTPLPSDSSMANPMGALMAASLGAGEVFKRIVGASVEEAPPLDLEQISLFEMSTEFSDDGPELPAHLAVPPTMLVGAGAIGNGIALVLSQLPASGRMHFVDKQAYADENLGTCVLSEREGWVGEGKAARLAAWLNEHSSIEATGERAFIKEALSSEAVKLLAPRIILNGLDDVAARHDSQLAWPDLIIDGGINDVGAAVSQHRLDSSGLACLRCAFEMPVRDHVAIQQQATGLPAEALHDQERPLTAEDVALAKPDKQAWLSERLRQGKNICSVVNEATLANLGVDAPDDFRPSVPFVATASAALVVAEYVKAQLFPTRRYYQSFTIGNLFLGTTSTAALDRAAKGTCLCVSRRTAIDALRARRAP